MSTPEGCEPANGPDNGSGNRWFPTRNNKRENSQPRIGCAAATGLWAGVERAVSGNDKRPNNKHDAFIAHTGPDAARSFEFGEPMKRCPERLGRSVYIFAEW